MKILMVCLGKYLSPLAHGIMQSTRRTTFHGEVDLAGTGGWHAGEAPDFLDSFWEAKNMWPGYSKNNVRAKLPQFSTLTIWLILTMDAQNYNDVVALTKSEAKEQKDWLELFWS